MKDITIPESMEREVKSIVLVALGAFLFFFYIFASGVEDVYTALTENSQQYIAIADKQVYGTSTKIDEDRLVSLRLNNSVLGEGVLEYRFPSKTSFAGSELFLEIEGNLEILDVVCEPGFMCMNDQSDNVLDITILRLPEYADVPLIGDQKVATILYDHVTSGELIMNSDTGERSTLVESGSDLNLMNPVVNYMFAGNYKAE